MKAPVPPRIYCLPAIEAPIVAVFRRGPSDWCHVGRWDLAKGYQAGAWLKGRIFPRRSDLSPDGRWLSYFAYQPSARWVHGESYVAVSKLPWLSALHAFGTCGTWTRGYYFSSDHTDDTAEVIKLTIPYTLRPIPVVQFANERRRGWEETPDCPSRHHKDFWDERRNARLRKPNPKDDGWLCVESRGFAGGEFGLEQAVDGLRVAYWLEINDDLLPLDDVQWADWSSDGRLLTATRSGRLEIGTLKASGLRTQCVADLSEMQPTPTLAPETATRWF